MDDQVFFAGRNVRKISLLTKPWDSSYLISMEHFVLGYMTTGQVSYCGKYGTCSGLGIWQGAGNHYHLRWVPAYHRLWTHLTFPSQSTTTRCLFASCVVATWPLCCTSLLAALSLLFLALALSSFCGSQSPDVHRVRLFQFVKYLMTFLKFPIYPLSSF